MKLIDMTCPHCGGALKINPDNRTCVCNYCGARLILDNETLHLQFDNAYESGYQFEKGRQRAQAEAYRQYTAPQPSYSAPRGKKAPTWLWVLGWIFIFPIPLTILMLRNKNMDNKVKYGIIAAAWIAYLCIGAFWGADESNNNSSNTNSNPVVTSAENNSAEKETTKPKQNISPQTTTSTTSSETEMEDTATTVSVESKDNNIVYAEDEVVNRFITEFNSSSSFEITDISKGNIRTKYFGHVNNRYLEMINANDAGAASFCLTINGGQKESDKQEMLAVFRESVKVFDPSISDEESNAAINDFVGNDVLVEGYAIGSHIIITYVPSKELSWGTSKCRIDMAVDNYK